MQSTFKMPDTIGYQRGYQPKRPPRRLQGLQSMASTVVSNTSYLPTELQIAVLGYLGQRDLKNVRLVSKAWCSPATPPLFDRLYVSPRPRDMEVFEEVTRHPVLCATIREIVYDTSHIPEMPYHEYFHKVCRHIEVVLLSGKEPSNLDQGLNEVVAALASGDTGHATLLTDLFNEYRNASFFVDAYQNWGALAKYESRVLLGKHKVPLFYSEVHVGMQCLKCLRSFVVRDDLWDEYCTLDSSTLTADLSGSPLKRSWHPLHLRPTTLTVSNRYRVFRIFREITRILAESPRSITRLEFCLLT